MKIRQKLRSRSGLSLAETLFAVLILVLVSIIVAEGMPAAKNAYEKVVVAANAKVMLSNAVAMLRNELALAQRIVVDQTDNSITYFSADRGATSKIYLSPSGDEQFPAGTVMLQEYLDYGDAAGIDTGFFEILNEGWTPTRASVDPAKARALVTSLEAQRGLKDKLIVCYDKENGGIAYDKDSRIVTIKGLKVYRASDTARNHPLAEYGQEGTDELKIRVIPNDADFAPVAAVD